MKKLSHELIYEFISTIDPLTGGKVEDLLIKVSHQLANKSFLAGMRHAIECIQALKAEGDALELTEQEYQQKIKDLISFELIGPNTGS